MLENESSEYNLEASGTSPDDNSNISVKQSDTNAHDVEQTDRKADTEYCKLQPSPVDVKGEYASIDPESATVPSDGPVYSEVSSVAIRPVDHFQHNKMEQNIAKQTQVGEGDLNAEEEEGIVIEENELYHTQVEFADMNAEEDGIVIEENDAYYTK